MINGWGDTEQTVVQQAVQKYAEIYEDQIDNHAHFILKVVQF